MTWRPCGIQAKWRDTQRAEFHGTWQRASRGPFAPCRLQREIRGVAPSSSLAATTCPMHHAPSKTTIPEPIATHPSSVAALLESSGTWPSLPYPSNYTLSLINLTATILGNQQPTWPRAPFYLAAADSPQTLILDMLYWWQLLAVISFQPDQNRCLTRAIGRISRTSL